MTEPQKVSIKYETKIHSLHKSCYCKNLTAQKKENCFGLWKIMRFYEAMSFFSPSLSANGAHPGGWKKKNIYFLEETPSPTTPFQIPAYAHLGSWVCDAIELLKVVMKVELSLHPIFF